MTIEYSIQLLDWEALAPGFDGHSAWTHWANCDENVLRTEPTKVVTSHVPMMTARRLGRGTTMALEAALRIIRRQPVDAIVCTSRHGEIGKSFEIHRQIAQGEDVSPAEFATSVHNTASGLLTILLKQDLPASSISAGNDSFQQGMVEAFGFLNDGMQTVLLVDYENVLPEMYHSRVEPLTPPYAVAMAIASGVGLKCSGSRHSNERAQVPCALPQSVQFLRGWLRDKSRFDVISETSRWVWTTSPHGTI